MIEEQIKVFEKNISKVINKYEKLLLNLTKEMFFSKLNFETKHITTGASCLRVYSVIYRKLKGEKDERL